MTIPRRWDPATGGWVPEEAGPAEGDPLVADSWLVEEGCVRGLELHWARFSAGMRDAGFGTEPAAGFRSAAERALPGDGRWFPRVDLRAGGELRLILRPAPPPAGDTVAAWLADGPDPRTLPHRKGPELTLLGRMRQAAGRHGAGEAVLAGADGGLLEGAYSSLLWWEDDVLCVVEDAAPILPGVTRRLLLELAAGAGVRVRRGPPPALGALAGREVWLTSALYGIRVVTAWRPDGPPCGAQLRAPEWRARLSTLARPVGARAPRWAG